MFRKPDVHVENLSLLSSVSPFCCSSGRLDENFVNFFSSCDAFAALMWAVALGTWTSLALFMIQRIFTFSQFMEVSKYISRLNVIRLHIIWLNLSLLHSVV